MFSDALRILDENTVKYMVEEMKQELEVKEQEIQKQKQEMEKEKQELEAQKQIVEECLAHQSSKTPQLNRTRKCPSQF